MRNDGEIDAERYKVVFESSSGEHQLQVQIRDNLITTEYKIKSTYD